MICLISKIVNLLISNTRSTLRPVCSDSYSPGGAPVNTKHLYNFCTMLGQRRRRWAGVVQMLYKCFEFAGLLCSLPRVRGGGGYGWDGSFGVADHSATKLS